MFTKFRLQLLLSLLEWAYHASEDDECRWQCSSIPIQRAPARYPSRIPPTMKPSFRLHPQGLVKYALSFACNDQRLWSAISFQKTVYNLHMFKPNMQFAFKKAERKLEVEQARQRMRSITPGSRTPPEMNLVQTAHIHTHQINNGQYLIQSQWLPIGTHLDPKTLIQTAPNAPIRSATKEGPKVVSSHQASQTTAEVVTEQVCIKWLCCYKPFIIDPVIDQSCDRIQMLWNGIGIKPAAAQQDPPPFPQETLLQTAAWLT